MKAQSRNQVLLGVLIIIVIGTFLLLTFINRPPAFHFDCTNGSILGISGPIPPVVCIGCFKFCDGHIIVKNEENEMICEQQGRTISLTETPKRVDVICPGLEKYMDKKVLLKYEINSTYGFYSDEIQVTVKW